MPVQCKDLTGFVFTRLIPPSQTRQVSAMTLQCLIIDRPTGFAFTGLIGPPQTGTPLQRFINAFLLGFTHNKLLTSPEAGTSDKRI